MTERKAGFWILVTGAIGLISSFVLTVDVIKSAANDSYVPSCNINPLLSCVSVMESTQSEVFGAPNSLFGAILFTAITVLGGLLLVDVQYIPLVWRLLLLGVGLGFLGVQYLIGVSVFVLGAICPWCFVVWHVVAVLLWAIVRYGAEHKLIHVEKYPSSLRIEKWLLKNSTTILLFWWLAVMSLLVVRFSDIWSML